MPFKNIGWLTLGPCHRCHQADGTLDTDLLNDNGTCVFGCGVPVETDTGICPRCHEHSGNRFECGECDDAYENWGQGWQRTES